MCNIGDGILIVRSALYTNVHSFIYIYTDTLTAYVRMCILNPSDKLSFALSVNAIRIM